MVIKPVAKLVIIIERVTESWVSVVITTQCLSSQWLQLPWTRTGWYSKMVLLDQARVRVTRTWSSPVWPGGRRQEVTLHLLLVYSTAHYLPSFLQLCPAEAVKIHKFTTHSQCSEEFLTQPMLASNSMTKLGKSFEFSPTLTNVHLHWRRNY